MKLNIDNKTKFSVGNVKDYAGEDLIFLIGCPGSRWSSVFLSLSKNPAINTTEWREENKWDKPINDVNGNLIKIGVHRGVYWGPGQKHGQRFDRLYDLSKIEILTEFMEPFENWDGIKVIKSHWFAYHIDYLHALFPKAKIVSSYANDIDSFYWWHKCGGWGMLFPNYIWYENDSKLLEKIKEENYRILKFNKDKNVNFKLLTQSQFYANLGLPPIALETDPVLKCEVAIYDGSHMPNFGHITR
jgi:hypothetical protein